MVFSRSQTASLTLCSFETVSAISRASHSAVINLAVKSRIFISFPSASVIHLNFSSKVCRNLPCKDRNSLALSLVDIPDRRDSQSSKLPSETSTKSLPVSHTGLTSSKSRCRSVFVSHSSLLAWCSSVFSSARRRLSWYIRPNLNTRTALASSGPISFNRFFAPGSSTHVQMSHGSSKACCCWTPSGKFAG